MPKDFTAWHKEKDRIERAGSLPDFRERDVWWASVGANVGSEEDGKHEHFLRPVLIFEKFRMRQVRDSLLAML